MNNNIDLTKILKDCPKGWKFYTPVWGEVTFIEIKKNKDCLFPICIYTNTSNSCTNLTKDGRYLINRTGTECILFPSKDQRDWSKFTAPWYKKERDTIALLEKQYEQKKQIHFPKFTFDDVLALQCCMETVKKVQEDKELYNQLNLIHNKIYDAYCLGKQDEISLILSNTSNTGKNEQKSADKIEQKFKVGDWIISSVLGTAHIIGTNDSNEFQLEYIDGKQKFSSINYVNYAYDKWTIEDAKDGDVLAAHECYVVFKEIDGLNIKCYCTYHYLGLNPSFYRDTLQNKDAFLPATKEQRDSFMKAMNDAGYEWDIEKKELNKKKKFDPKTLQPFDKILVRRGNENYNVWFPDFVSEPPNDTNNKTLCMCIMEDITMVIPYNDETKNLIGTTYDAPEHYKYWED